MIYISKEGPIKLIAFDLGYTLVYNLREVYYLRYLEKQNIIVSREKVDHAFHHTDKIFMRHYIGALGRSPESFLPWYLGVVNYELGLLLDLNDQSTFFMNQVDEKTYWQLYPWTKDILAELKELGYQVALLSNWDSGCRGLLKNLGISHYFDTILVSSEIGIEKPDQRIFELLMEETGLNAEEILYIGDNYYDDVNGSRKVGIETILINRFGKIGIEEIDDCQIIKSTSDLLELLQEAKTMANIMK